MSANDMWLPQNPECTHVESSYFERDVGQWNVKLAKDYMRGHGMCVRVKKYRPTTLSISQGHHA